MALQPLLSASPAIQFHAAAAITAFALGALQFWLPKGTRWHRTLGWVWVLLMAAVALSSFRIHTICTLWGFSLIHLLSILTLVSLPLAVRHARQHRIEKHAKAMKILFFAALLIAGAFTFTPGRIMYDMALGATTAHGTCVP